MPAFSRFTFTAIQRELANSTLAEFGTVDYKQTPQTPQGREKKRFEAVGAYQQYQQIQCIIVSQQLLSQSISGFGAALGLVPGRFHGQVERGSKEGPGKVPVLVRGRLRENSNAGFGMLLCGKVSVF